MFIIYRNVTSEANVNSSLEGQVKFLMEECRGLRQEVNALKDILKGGNWMIGGELPPENYATPTHIFEVRFANSLHYGIHYTSLAVVLL